MRRSLIHLITSGTAIIIASLAAWSVSPLHAKPERHKAIPLEIFVDDPEPIVKLTYYGSLEWSFFRAEEYCYATLGNNSDRLLIGFNQNYDQAHIGFWSTAAPVAADNSQATLRFVVLKRAFDGSLLEESPDDVPFMIYHNDLGKSVYNTVADGLDTLSTLGQAESLEFRTLSGAVISRFSMHGSAKALRRLSTCKPR